MFKTQSQFKDFSRVCLYLESFIKFNLVKNKKASLDRVLYFMNLLGNPQNKIKIIHVAGTSGKGSVCTFLSQILASQNLKVGLTVSPHIYTIQERLQINNVSIKKTEFVDLFNFVYPFIKKMSDTKHGPPSYFEIIIGMAYLYFYNNKVDVAVIETGLGGLLDATNSVGSENKIAVITKIGLDHQDLLGKTIPKIALQKAGIIHKNNLVFFLKNRTDVNNIFINVSKSKNAKFEICEFRKVLKNVKFANGDLRADFNGKNIYIQNLEFLNCPNYQIENLAISLQVVEAFLTRENIELNPQNLVLCLKKLSIPARFETRVINNKTVIFDGAHNPQKMRAFLYSLKSRYKKAKFNFIVAFKKGKDYKKMLKDIALNANFIYLTDFSSTDQGITVKSMEPIILKNELESKSYISNYEVISNPNVALQKLLISADNSVIVVTGSLYLMSNILKFLKQSKNKPHRI